MCPRKRCCLACPQDLKAHGVGELGRVRVQGIGLSAAAGGILVFSSAPQRVLEAGSDVLTGAGRAPRLGCGRGWCAGCRDPLAEGSLSLSLEAILGHMLMARASLGR